jgi:hypothetical protein
VKTTIDLPEPLVREMKLRAVQEGRKLKDVAAEVFQRGLQAPVQGVGQPLRQTLDTPVFVCEAGRATAPGRTVEQLLRLEQAAQTEEDLQRVGRSL